MLECLLQNYENANIKLLATLTLLYNPFFKENTLFILELNILTFQNFRIQAQHRFRGTKGL